MRRQQRKAQFDGVRSLFIDVAGAGGYPAKDVDRWYANAELEFTDSDRAPVPFGTLNLHRLPGVTGAPTGQVVQKLLDDPDVGWLAAMLHLNDLTPYFQHSPVPTEQLAEPYPLGAWLRSWQEPAMKLGADAFERTELETFHPVLWKDWDAYRTIGDSGQLKLVLVSGLLTEPQWLNSPLEAVFVTAAARHLSPDPNTVLVMDLSASLADPEPITGNMVLRQERFDLFVRAGWSPYRCSTLLWAAHRLPDLDALASHVLDPQTAPSLHSV